MTTDELRKNVTANQARLLRQLNDVSAELMRLKKLHRKLEIDIAMQQGSLDTLGILENEKDEKGEKEE